MKSVGETVFNVRIKSKANRFLKHCFIQDVSELV